MLRILIKIAQYIYCIYALICFIIIMILVLPFVVFSALALGKINGGNWAYKFCKVWGHSWYFLIGVWHNEIYETPHDRTKQYIFTPNHISYMDAPAMTLGIHQSFRALGKYELLKVPIFGIIYKAAVVVVDRSSAEARARSVRALRVALKQGISICIFPEGTFNETAEPLKEFFDGAFRLAIETETPIKPILLIDTVDRMHFSSIFSLKPGKCRVVYLEEIPVNGLTLKDMNQLKEKVYQAMDAGLRRYRKYPTSLTA